MVIFQDFQGPLQKYPVFQDFPGLESYKLNSRTFQEIKDRSNPVNNPTPVKMTQEWLFQSHNGFDHKIVESGFYLAPSQPQFTKYDNSMYNTSASIFHTCPASSARQFLQFYSVTPTQPENKKFQHQNAKPYGSWSFDISAHTIPSTDVANVRNRSKER